jgi:hypothetical protein
MVPALVPKVSPNLDPLPETEVGGTIGVVELDAGLVPKLEPDPKSKPDLEPELIVVVVVMLVPSPGRGSVLFTGDAYGVLFCILGIALRGVLEPDADPPAFEFVTTFVFRGGLASFVFGVLAATVGVLGLL